MAWARAKTLLMESRLKVPSAEVLNQSYPSGPPLEEMIIPNTRGETVGELDQTKEVAGFFMLTTLMPGPSKTAVEALN